MPPATGEPRAPARPGRNSPHLQKSGLRGSFSLSAPESGAGGAGVPGCYGRVDVPGVDLCCTRRVPAMDLGRYSAGPGRARPPNGGGLLTVFTFTRGAGLGGRGRPRLARGRGCGPCRAPRWRPWSAGGTPAACAVCSRESTARRARPWRGRRLDRHREDVATYRGRVRRPRAGRLLASPFSRPVPACPAAGTEGRRPGSRGGAGDGQRKWQTVYPGSRTCHHAAPPANTGTNTGTCRQRGPLSGADVQDTAEINLPVDSQTV